jgi:hypothetical protein
MSGVAANWWEGKALLHPIFRSLRFIACDDGETANLRKCSRKANPFPSRTIWQRSSRFNFLLVLVVVLDFFDYEDDNANQPDAEPNGWFTAQSG